MKEAPSYYAILTADIRYNSNLSANAKLLYAELTALSQKEGYCWASNHYFAELYAVHKDTISKWVGELIKENLVSIEVHKDKGNLRKIYLKNISYPIGKKTETIGKNAYRYRQKRLDPIGKNADIIIQENNKKNRDLKNKEKNEDNRGTSSPALEKLRQARKTQNWASLKAGK